MARISRRQAMASLGLLSGTGLLGGCQRAASPLPNLSAAKAANEPPAGGGRAGAAEASAYRYVELDPALIGETTYRIYPQGGCMYAVTGSVISALAELLGEPFRSFPVEMMRYGDGGVGGWGSLCGVINGGAALIGLFHREREKRGREELVTELCTWYETCPLPQFQPTVPEWAPDAPPSVAGSVLCHVSLGRWCQASGCKAFSMEKKERCRRLATDGAMKVVEILNRKAKGHCESADLPPEVKACVDCHGKQRLADSMGKMRCQTCHEFRGPHPSLGKGE